jgi:hypothetical protein
MANLSHWTETRLDWWARQRSAGLRVFLLRRLPEQVLVIALVVWLPRLLGATELSRPWMLGLSVAGLALAGAVFCGFWWWAGRRLGRPGLRAR